MTGFRASLQTTGSKSVFPLRDACLSCWVAYLSVCLRAVPVLAPRRARLGIWTSITIRRTSSRGTA